MLKDLTRLGGQVCAGVSVLHNGVSTQSKHATCLCAHLIKCNMHKLRLFICTPKVC